MILDSAKYHKELGDVEKKTSNFGNVLMGLGKGIALAGVAAAGTAIAGFGAFLVDSTKAAMDAQKVDAQLNAVLKSTKSISGMTADSVKNLALSLSKITPYEDDAIVSGENMLLTFTNIGKDVFPTATEAMLNMSTALGQDLQSSAMQLGKALNDPIAGVTALKRVGVNFSDAQRDMIKTMVESGDVMGAQKFILSELNTEFGNSAKAAGETFAGKMDILNNAIGNVKENIGNAFLPILTKVADKLATFVNSEQFQTFINNLTSSVDKFMASPAVAAIGNFIDKLIGGKPITESDVRAIFDPIIAAINTTSASPEFQVAAKAMGDMLATIAVAGFKSLFTWENLKTAFNFDVQMNKVGGDMMAQMMTGLFGVDLGTPFGKWLKESLSFAVTSANPFGMGINLISQFINGIKTFLGIAENLSTGINQQQYTPLQIRGMPTGPGFASGGAFTVPQGFPNDTFPMRVSSGEKVAVTPAGQQQKLDLSDSSLRKLSALILAGSQQ